VWVLVSAVRQYDGLRKKKIKMMKNKNEGGGQGAIWSIGGIQEEYHLGMQGVIISHVIHQQQH
jgi:hypothetical protein